MFYLYSEKVAAYDEIVKAAKGEECDVTKIFGEGAENEGTIKAAVSKYNNATVAEYANDLFKSYGFGDMAMTAEAAAITVTLPTYLADNKEVIVAVINAKDAEGKALKVTAEAAEEDAEATAEKKFTVEGGELASATVSIVAYGTTYDFAVVVEEAAADVEGGDDSADDSEDDSEANA